MKCDRCELEATVHEVRIEAGKRREKHLCEQCARADGVATPQVPAPLTTLLSSFMLQQGEAAAVPPQPQSVAMTTPCTECGTTYAQFRQSGILGCPNCYAQFENQLVPLLARAHEGGTSHKGKSPRRLSGTPGAPTQIAKAKPAAAQSPIVPAIDPQTVARLLVERIAMLKKRLTEAVVAEEYEKAAKLRDELARLEGMPQTGTLPTPSAAKRKPRAPGERSQHNPPNPDGPHGTGEAAP